MSATKLIIERGDFQGLPMSCASCLTTDGLEYKMVHSPSTFGSEWFEVSVPMCPRCSRRTHWTRLLSLVLAIVVVTSFIANHGRQKWQLSAVWAFLIVFAPLIDALFRDRLNGPVRVQAKADGKLIFWFSNPDYARLFGARNQRSYSSASKAGVL